MTALFILPLLLVLLIIIIINNILYGFILERRLGFYVDILFIIMRMAFNFWDVYKEVIDFIISVIVIKSLAYSNSYLTWISIQRFGTCYKESSIWSRGSNTLSLSLAGISGWGSFLSFPNLWHASFFFEWQQSQRS